MSNVRDFDLNSEYYMQDLEDESDNSEMKSTENVFFDTTNVGMEDIPGLDYDHDIIGSLEDEIEDRAENIILDDENIGDVSKNIILEEENFGDGSENIITPYLGMICNTVDELLYHCHEYAKTVGFQIRIRGSERKKGVTSDTNGDINRHTHDYSDCCRLRLVCSKEGKFVSKSKNPRRSTSTIMSGCQFKVNASVTPDGSWSVKKVVLDHNHECVPENSKFLPNYRFINPFNRRMILDNDQAGVPIGKNYNSCVVRYGGHNNVPFTEKDCRNMISKERRLGLENGDFAAMRRYFETMIASKSGFFYMYDTTADGTLKNVFWADGRSRAAFKDFGDVVSFDTTYVKNRYKMPFAPFIGVNNHGQSILFGCGLLAGEEIENYVWLFNTWLSCMSNKAPVAILTDQCKSIGNAISRVLPNTRHRWCIWHIMRNAKKHLEKCRAGWEDISKGLKDALHDTFSISEFEDAWQEWVIKFGLQESKWCEEMYAQRHRWVPVYFKDQFWAGMSSTQRSEGMNNFFKGFLNMNTTLKQFVEQYGFALAKRVREEDNANFRSCDSPILCATDHVFEVVFQKLYTSAKFKDFQDNVKAMVYANATKLQDDGKLCLYDIVVRRFVKGHTKRASFRVTMDRESLDIKCECKNFEFKGIICTHSLCVFHEEEFKFVPERYIVDRWRKDMPREHLKIPVPYYSLLKHKPKEMERYESMQNAFESLSSLAMYDEPLYNDVMEAISTLSLKETGTNSNNELMTQQWGNIGKVYGRRSVHSNEERRVNLEIGNESINVKDPVDRRGKGRAPTRRKGYHNERRPRKRSQTSQQQNVPYGFQIVTPMQQSYGFLSNVLVNPPFHVTSSPSLPYQHQRHGENSGL